MRVVLPHDLADHAGTLRERLVRAESAVVHAVDHAAVHGLEAVAHVGERAPDDHGHGVVEVAALHLRLQVDLVDLAVVVALVDVGTFFVSHVFSSISGR